MSVFLKRFVNSKTKRKLDRYKKNEAGNIGIMVALCATVFIGCLAIAIDLSNAYASKARLQDTTDAIALLAVRNNLTNRSDLSQAAQSYMASKYRGSVTDRVQVDSITRTGNAVRIKASNNIDTYFSLIFGRNSLDVVVESEAIYDNRGLDLALVLDTTGSMQGVKLADLKTAANNLITELRSQNNNNIRMSVVPFSQYVNVGANNRNRPWIDDLAGRNWNGCVGSRPGNAFNDAGFNGAPFPAINVRYCPNAIQPLSRNLVNASRAINNMQAEGWTYMPAGLAWGYRTLNGEVPFTQARSTNPSVRGTERVLVLMSDGANTRSVSGNTHDAVNLRDANRRTERLCSTIKNDNIKVYTIAFQLSNDAQSREARRILQRCANDNTQFFDAQTAGELQDAFRAIGNSLLELRITA